MGRRQTGQPPLATRACCRSCHHPPAAGDALAQVNVQESNNVDPIVISAQAANRWQEGAYEVWLLRGDCRLTQGGDAAVCQEAVFWIEHAAPVRTSARR